MAEYYNAYSDNGRVFIESEAMDYFEALQELADNLDGKFPYAYTIAVDGSNIQKMDWEDEARALNNNAHEYERLTGHEYGIFSGRI